MKTEQLEKEISYTTARSGGKGGQNVNKVESAVTAFWFPAQSEFLDEKQKLIVEEKLAKRMNGEGAVIIKSQTHRSQLANKQESLEKLLKLVEQALTIKKARIASKAGKAVKEKRLQEKKRKALIKQGRAKQNWD